MISRIFEKLQPLAGNMNPDNIRGNIERSLALGLPEVLTPETIGKADPDQTVCIVNPGPSARTPEMLQELNRGVDENGKKMLIVLGNSGLGMLDRGLDHADVFVASHPDSKTVEAFPKLGAAEMEYWLASMVAAGADPANPSIFKHLEDQGRTPKIWHAHLDGLTETFDRAGKVSVGTGSGAPIAALALFAALGYKKFRVYGMDGSAQYAVDLGNTEAMKQYLDGLKAGEMPVSVKERVFTVTREFWPQTQEGVHFLKTYPDAVRSIWFSGDTANAAIFNSWNGDEFGCGEILDLSAGPGQ